MLQIYVRFVVDKHENAPVFQRLTLIDNEFPGAAVLLHKFGVMIKVLLSVDFCKSFTLYLYILSLYVFTEIPKNLAVA